MIGCYTFYSYKGGSGRSTALLNTVRYLIQELEAGPDKPILLVDADLESAGLTYYFGCQSKFSGDLNTASVLNKATALFNKENEEVIFGESDETYGMITCGESEAWGLLKELDSRDTATGRKISEVFKDVVLPGKCFAALKRIIVDMTYGMQYIDSDGRDIWAIKEELKSIDSNGSIDGTEKQIRKSEVLDSFLPVRSFMDVSHYFCDESNILPEGTVRFLGTDVSNEARLTRGDAQNAVARLKKKCANHNYCAIIFDSGAGTQTSAYILHGSSDVIVYCMRPTLQFIDGTKDNLSRFRQILSDHRKSDSSKKPVILFPNAVPEVSDEFRPFMEYSFGEIEKIANVCADIVDDTFCSYESCIHEVPLFKWREKVLGCSDLHLPDDAPEDLRKAVEVYSRDMLPEGMDQYARVYKNLAERLIHNT